MPVGSTAQLGIGLIGLPNVATTPGQLTPVTMQNTDAVTINYGELAYVFTDGTLKRATKNGTEAQAYATHICVSVGGVTAGSTGRFTTLGRVTGLAGGTAGSNAFLGDNGVITTTVPTTVGQFLVPVGVWVTTTVFNFNPQQPNPL
jgi:hypothetical protein